MHLSAKPIAKGPDLQCPSCLDPQLRIRMVMSHLCHMHNRKCHTEWCTEQRKLNTEQKDATRLCNSQQREQRHKMLSSSKALCIVESLRNISLPVPCLSNSESLSKSSSPAAMKRVGCTSGVRCFQIFSFRSAHVLPSCR